MLQGKRVVLRAIERTDLPAYVRWLNDLRVLEYFGRYQPLSLADEEKWYSDMLEDDRACNFAVEVAQEHVGGAGFCNIDHRNRSAEVGLFIGVPELWDQGLGLDVLEILLAYGFEQLNLNRIALRVFAENKRAIHLYEKTGFRHEGTWRQAEFRHGRYLDMQWMSILRVEWLASRTVAPRKLG